MALHSDVHVLPWPALRDAASPPASPIQQPILAPRPSEAQAWEQIPTDLASIAAAPALADWLRDLVGASAYALGAQRARVNGTDIHAELLAAAAVSGRAYARSLAERLGFAWLPSAEPTEPHAAADAASGFGAREIPVWFNGVAHRVIDAEYLPPEAILRHALRLQASGYHVALAERAVVDAFEERQHGRVRLARAVDDLRRLTPSRSAATGWRARQVATPVAMLGVVAGGMAVLPEATASAVSLLLGLPFLCITVIRLLALREVVRPGLRRALRRKPMPVRRLPRYSVLVPLFRETEVLDDLVASLATLDYPTSKLEVLLLIEASDLAMQAALLGMRLPLHFRVLVVPDCEPRTKPKALNYGLQFACGDLVVVFDAEDRPQAQQLRRAAEAFARGSADTACVQAQLNIYNPQQGWFARQFTIEYSALFDAILPALENLRLPVPLGGTSNHFRREMLVALGGWDPFNVTEDADLGIRLARSGFKTKVIASTTWEEAPTTFKVWLPQRTRWLKGWMQTWLVHTRERGALRRELGLVGTAGFHAVMGGLLLSALVQPLFFALVVYQAWAGTLFDPAQQPLEIAMVWISWGNLAVGYVMSMLVGMISVWRRGRIGLILHALMMPLYWLLISLAAYRALYQLVRAPFVWEKTPHGAARSRRRSSR